jgi:hypothetical protein
MIDMHSADRSVSERDGKSKQNSSGIGYSEASDKMSSWNRGRGFNGGNNNGGYNGGVGRLNNGNRYTCPSGAHNSNQLQWRQNSDVFNRQGSDVIQQKYNPPMMNPNAFNSSCPFLQYGFTSLPLSITDTFQLRHHIITLLRVSVSSSPRRGSWFLAINSSARHVRSTNQATVAEDFTVALQAAIAVSRPTSRENRIMTNSRAFTCHTTLAESVY